MCCRSAWLLAILPLLPGCGASQTHSSASLHRPVERQNADSTPAVATQLQRVSHVSHEPALPRLGAGRTCGIWLDDGAGCWLHLEKPRVRIVCINRDVKSGWLLEGHYSYARDGSIFGCMHAVGRIAEPALAGLNWDNEATLRGLALSKVSLPFQCELCADGDALKILEFRGPKFDDDRDRWHGRSFRKAALAGPGHAVASIPSGNWIRRPEETRDRVLVSIAPDRIGVTIVDGKAGKRARWQGECAPAPDGLLYGTLTTVDHAIGGDNPEPLAPPPLFCLRYAATGDRLQILGVECLDLDEATRVRLLGEYRPE